MVGKILKGVYAGKENIMEIIRSQGDCHLLQAKSPGGGSYP